MTDLSEVMDVAPSDEAMTLRLTSLMWRMIEEAEDIIENGSQRDKVRLLAANIPALTRTLRSDETAQMEKVRTVVIQLMGSLRSDLIPSFGDD